MALPSSGSISLDQIAAEFGGDAPHSIQEYYRGGGLVPDIPANASVPTGVPISLQNFYGATAAAPVNPAGGSFTNYQNAASATCRLIVKTDGSIRVEYLRDGSLNSLAATHNWYSPNVAGIGNTHWVRFTRTSESLGSNGTRTTTATTGWLALTSDQLVDAFANATAANSTFAQGVYTVDISTASGGSPIVATASYTLRAESDRS